MNGCTKRSTRLAAAAFASALVLAACNGEDAPEAPNDEAGSIAENYDFSGLSVHVGTKDFDEQYILAQIVVQALEAAGAEVEYTQDLASPDGARNALLAGERDRAAEEAGAAGVN
jgi:osmoprotectant transport system substrate-binding protein